MAVLIEHLSDIEHDGAALCSYKRALHRMNELVERDNDDADVLIAVQHPPTITIGRRGGREHIHSTRLAIAGREAVEVEVHEVARGGSVTYHAPGQLVVYPIVNVPRWTGQRSRMPYGDLPAFVRALEAELQASCAAFGVRTIARPGFAGLWCDAHTKIASIGVGVRRGWSFHGLALNVNPHLRGFELIAPCGLAGIRMTSMWQQQQAHSLPTVSLRVVQDDLLRRLQRVFEAPRATS